MKKLLFISISCILFFTFESCCTPSYIYVGLRRKEDFSPYYDCFSTGKIIHLHKLIMKLGLKQYRYALKKADSFTYHLTPIYQKGECEGVYLYGTCFNVIGVANSYIPTLYYKNSIHTWEDENFNSLLEQFLAECPNIPKEKEAKIRKIFREKKLINTLEVSFNNP